MGTTTTMTTQDRLTRVRQLLGHNQNQEALCLLEQAEDHNDELRNARGVCLMRVGRVNEALKLLRDLAYHDSIVIPSERPALIQANLATALLLSDDTLQAIGIVGGLKASQHPYVAMLKQRLKAYKRQLSPWRRFLWAITLYPTQRIELGFPPGDL